MLRFNTKIQITSCNLHQETIIIIPIQQSFHKNENVYSNYMI